MKIFGFGRAMQRERDNQRQAERNELAASDFKLPTDGGDMLGLKYALFILFGYYNARLFLHTVPGGEGWMTAFFALAGEATALYCLNIYTRTAGGHKTAVGLFGAALTLFSVTHATISFFRIDRHVVASGPVQFYCQRIAFPLLFGLLLLAAIIIPLTHWRKKIAAERARAQTEIETGRARLLAESANLRNESQLERERLRFLEEQLMIEGEYVSKIEQFAQLKEREGQAIESISDPAVREQIAAMLGRSVEIRPTIKHRIGSPAHRKNEGIPYEEYNRKYGITDAPELPKGVARQYPSSGEWDTERKRSH